MQLMFYCHQKQTAESLILEPTADGWYLQHGCYTGLCEPDGKPYLQRYVEQQNSVLPAAFPDALEEIWLAYQSGNLQYENIQERLNHFSEWLKVYQQDSSFKLSDF